MEPIYIVEAHDDSSKKKFCCNYKVIDEIFNHPMIKKRKIVVVSIVGDYRKGKSFFLNYCLRFMNAHFTSFKNYEKSLTSDNWFGDPNEPLKGFSWKHGSVADTKGIIFWPDVFLHDYESGEKIATIFMDTQGLNAQGMLPDDSKRIFHLSTLISSIQIVNINHIINENNIVPFESITNITEEIMATKNRRETSWKPFQSLTFLIRDWTDEKHGFGFEGGEKYLDSFLNFKNAKTKTPQRGIHDSFEKINCFLLNDPGDVARSKGYDGEWEPLNPQFVENLKIFIESTLSPENLARKSIFGREVTGCEFYNYIYKISNDYCKTSLPDVERILEITIDSFMKATIDDCVKSYITAFKKEINHEEKNITFESSIEEVHEKIKRSTIDKFKNSNQIDDEKCVGKFSKILENEIDEKFKTMRQDLIEDHEKYSQYKHKFTKVRLLCHTVEGQDGSAYSKMIRRLKKFTMKYSLGFTVLSLLLFVMALTFGIFTFLYFTSRTDSANKKIICNSLVNDTELSCGNSTYAIPLVIGGQEIERGQAPWLVPIFSRSRNNNFTCSSSLISGRYLLGAAHCFYPKNLHLKPASDFYARIGAYDLSNSNENGSYNVNISSIIIHPSWNITSRQFDADIALLRLAYRVKFNAFVIPICLPNTKDSINDVKGVVVGYGKDESNDIVKIPKLIEIKSVSLEKCLFGQHKLVTIGSERMFCAGEESILPCQGDSGGGFYVEKNGVWTIYGIVSVAGDSNCKNNKFVLFTNVMYYMEWIEDEIEK